MWRTATAMAVALFTGSASVAVQAQSIAQAEGLFLANETAAARQAVESTGPVDPEEEIQRIWIKALSHMREDAPRAALPHLERLVTLVPDATRFRLELARALYLVEDNERAAFHFQQALGGTLSLAEIATVNEYLRAMENRKPWRGHMRVAVVSQSNPWHRSGEDFADIGGHLLLPLPEIERATGLEVGVGGTYQPQLGNDLYGRAHLMVTGQVFEEDKLNRWHLRSELGLMSLGDQGQQIGGGVTLQGAFGDQGRIMHGAGIYASFQRRFGNRTSLVIRVNADQLRYAGVPNLDGPRVAISAEGARIVSPQMRLHGSVSLSHHHTKAEFNRRSTASLTFGGQYAFAGGVIGGLEAQFVHGRMAEANPLQLQYGPERSNRVGLTAQMLHRDFTLRGFAPVLVMGYEHQTSTVPTNAFRNFKISLGATRSF